MQHNINEIAKNMKLRPCTEDERFLHDYDRTRGLFD